MERLAYVLETEAIIDRRQLRRRLAWWRSLALIAAGLAVVAYFASKDALSSLQPQIARISIEGTITEDRDQLLMLKKIRDDSNVKALLVFVNSREARHRAVKRCFKRFETWLL